MLALFIVTAFLLYVMFFPGTLIWVARNEKKLNQLMVQSFFTGLHGPDTWYQWFFFFGRNPSFKVSDPEADVPELKFIEYGMTRLTLFGVSWTRITYKIDKAGIKAMHEAANVDTPSEPEQ